MIARKILANLMNVAQFASPISMNTMKQRSDTHINILYMCTLIFVHNQNLDQKIQYCIALIWFFARSHIALTLTKNIKEIDLSFLI